MSNTSIQKIKRTTIVLGQAMHDDIKAYGKKRGCTSFSEAVRDLARTVLSNPKQQDQSNKFNHVNQEI